MSWLLRCNKPRDHVKYVNKKLRPACHCAKPSLICTHDACRCLVFVRTQDRLLPYIFCNKFKVLLICTFILGFLHFFICRKFSASSSELEDRSMVSITCTENISVTIIDNCLNQLEPNKEAKSVCLTSIVMDAPKWMAKFSRFSCQFVPNW